MSYETILYEPRGGVALITLNRPDKLNAWTHGMRDELIDAMGRANDDPAIGAMVVTGAGRGFCAGADIGAMFKRQLDGGETVGRGGPSQDWVAAVRAAKPMLAAVNGVSIGVGLTMILPF
ncbi:MAG TPA: enoyl-CoA hydratase-related protein, partial [Alphaproteobacteria bacterium]|nr:enoyl-CoA hydratase-related protein [Alphaproteobacteria bacterium]